MAGYNPYTMLLAQTFLNAMSQWGQNAADNKVNGEAKKIKDQVGFDGSGINSASQTVNNGDGTSTTTTQTTQPTGSFYSNQIGSADPLAGRGYGSLNQQGATAFNPGDKYNSGIANLKNDYALAQRTYEEATDQAIKDAAMQRMLQYNEQANQLRQEAADNNVRLASTLATPESGNYTDYLTEMRTQPQRIANQNMAANLMSGTGNYAYDKANGVGLFATGGTPVFTGVGSLYNQSAAAGNPQASAGNGSPVTDGVNQAAAAPSNGANPTAAITPNQAVGNPYSYDLSALGQKYPRLNTNNNAAGAGSLISGIRM